MFQKAIFLDAEFIKANRGKCTHWTTDKVRVVENA